MAQRGTEPGEVLAAAVVAAGLISVPAVLWFGLPGPAAWPWLIGAVLVNTIGIRCAMTAYRLASYGLAYPTMRAGIPLLTLPLAALVLSEWPRPAGAAGVVLIAAALIMLAFAARRSGTDELRGLGFALLSAATMAGCVIFDATGVRVGGNAIGYAFTGAIGNAVAIGLLMRVEGLNPVRMLARHAPRAFAISALSMTSYVLYIWAVSISPVALAAALRETSVLFAVAIARFVLGEDVGRYHLGAAVLALLGVAAIRLG